MDAVPSSIGTTLKRCDRFSTLKSSTLDGVKKDHDGFMPHVGLFVLVGEYDVRGTGMVRGREGRGREGEEGEGRRGKGREGKGRERKGRGGKGPCGERSEMESTCIGW